MKNLSGDSLDCFTRRQFWLDVYLSKIRYEGFASPMSDIDCKMAADKAVDAFDERMKEISKPE